MLKSTLLVCSRIWLIFILAVPIQLYSQDVAPLVLSSSEFSSKQIQEVESGVFSFQLIEFEDYKDCNNAQTLVGKSYQVIFDANHKAIVETNPKNWGAEYGKVSIRTKDEVINVNVLFDDLVECKLLYEVEFFDNTGSLTKTIELDFYQSTTFQDSVHEIVAFNVDSYKNIILSGWVNRLSEIFFAKFDSLGNQLAFSRMAYYIPTSIFNRSDGRLCFYTLAGQFAVNFLNEDLEIDSTISLPFDVPSVYNRPLIEDSCLIVSGIKSVHLTLNKVETLNKVNIYNGSVTNIVEIIPHLNPSKGMDGFFSLDKLGPYFYFGNMHTQDAMSCLVYATNAPICTNFFTINKVHENGTVAWSKYFGGDAAYHVVHVLATQDSGCVVIVDRRDIEVQDKHDVYYVKLDKDGNVQQNYFEGLNDFLGIKELPTESANNIVLYPNPARDYVSINSDNFKRVDVKIFNLNGQLVATKIVELNSQIDISSLNQGVYLLNIFQENTLVESKKLIKY